MEKLFAALRGLHPGHEVVDVRFLMNRSFPRELSVTALDAQLAYAVTHAQKMDVDAVVQAAQD